MPDLELLLQDRPHNDAVRERSREVVRERSPSCVKNHENIPAQIVTETFQKLKT